MDIVTQVALGGAIGQAGFRELGRRGVAFGALCGLTPDLDGLWAAGDPWQNLVTHRGPSHSLVVLPLVAIPLGWLGWRLMGRRGRPQTWIHLAFWALITHPLLDTCTTYGTQLLAPLSDMRFSWDVVAIVDLFYSLPLFAAIVVGFFKSSWPDRASRWARRALAWGGLYLVAQFAWTQANISVFEDRLASGGFVTEHIRMPVPLFWPVVRHGVARDANGRLAVSNQVLWAPERDPIHLIESETSPRIEAALASERGRIWRWFADGMVSVRTRSDGALVLPDHRYGLYTQHTTSIFRARLPAGAAPDALEFVSPREARRDLDMGAEFSAGWQLLTGE